MNSLIIITLLIALFSVVESATFLEIIAEKLSLPTVLGSGLYVCIIRSIFRLDGKLDKVLDMLTSMQADSDAKFSEMMKVLGDTRFTEMKTDSDAKFTEIMMKVLGDTRFTEMKTDSDAKCNQKRNLLSGNFAQRLSKIEGKYEYKDETST
jgi:hypothetical protein